MEKAGKNLKLKESFIIIKNNLRTNSYELWTSLLGENKFTDLLYAKLKEFDEALKKKEDFNRRRAQKDSNIIQKENKNYHFKEKFKPKDKEVNNISEKTS
jgi:hypothetical protein